MHWNNDVDQGIILFQCLDCLEESLEYICLSFPSHLSCTNDLLHHHIL